MNQTPTSAPTGCRQSRRNQAMTGATQDDLFDDESGVLMTTIECKVIEAMGKVLDYVEADLRQWRSAWDYVGPCAEKHTEARGHLDQSVLLVRKWLALPWRAGRCVVACPKRRCEPEDGGGNSQRPRCSGRRGRYLCRSQKSVLCARTQGARRQVNRRTDSLPGRNKRCWRVCR